MVRGIPEASSSVLERPPASSSTPRVCNMNYALCIMNACIDPGPKGKHGLPQWNVEWEQVIDGAAMTTFARNSFLICSSHSMKFHVVNVDSHPVTRVTLVVLLPIPSLGCIVSADTMISM